MGTRHTITRAEMNLLEIAHQIACSSGGGHPAKKVYFVYDIGDQRLGYDLGTSNEVRWFDDLDEAIAAYNEI